MLPLCFAFRDAKTYNDPVQLGPDGFFHLTYCTNIHPGDGCNEVLANLKKYGPALKQRLAPAKPFGLGLRLSSRESEELLQGDHLEQFAAFLKEQNLYVALINGFPYGSFHKRAIKEDVFAPDWREEARVQYTLRLLAILKSLLPPDMEGGISTSPLSYKRWIAPDDRTAWEQITRNIIRVAEAMAQVRQETGRLIHLDIEPEPDGLIENSVELVAFFEQRLLPANGREKILEHVQVCFDTCHFAVEYEDPKAILDRFARAGIKVGRVQISAALDIVLPDNLKSREEIAAHLTPFAESTYLHQLIEHRHGHPLRRFSDLPNALPTLQEPGTRQWRIHFHVPLFIEQYAMFGSTQGEIRTVLNLLRSRKFTRHLEIETYTWDVLPPAYKQDLLESIHREYQWVLDELKI